MLNKKNKQEILKNEIGKEIQSAATFFFLRNFIHTQYPRERESRSGDCLMICQAEKRWERRIKHVYRKGKSDSGKEVPYH